MSKINGSHAANKLTVISAPYVATYNLADAKRLGYPTDKKEFTLTPNEARMRGFESDITIKVRIDPNAPFMSDSLDNNGRRLFDDNGKAVPKSAGFADLFSF